MFHHAAAIVTTKFITATANPGGNGVNVPAAGDAPGGGLISKLAVLAGIIISIVLVIRGVSAMTKHPNRKLADTGVEGANMGYGLFLIALGVGVTGTMILTNFGGFANWMFS